MDSNIALGGLEMAETPKNERKIQVSSGTRKFGDSIMASVAGTRHNSLSLISVVGSPANIRVNEGLDE